MCNAWRANRLSCLACEDTSLNMGSAAAVGCRFLHSVLYQPSVHDVARIDEPISPNIEIRRLSLVSAALSTGLDACAARSRHALSTRSLRPDHDHFIHFRAHMADGTAFEWKEGRTMHSGVRFVELTFH